MADRVEHWESMWGARYDSNELKDGAVRDAIGTIVLPGETPVIVDYGCGAFPVSRMVLPAQDQTIYRAFIDLAGREIEDVDEDSPFAPLLARDSSTSILIQGDIDEMAKGVPHARRANKMLRSFLCAHNPEGKPEADMAVMSDILNYVHHERAIGFATRHLRVGGTLFVVNEASRGFSDVFSSQKLRNDLALGSMLQERFGYGDICEAVGYSMFSSSVGATILTAVKTA